MLPVFELAVPFFPRYDSTRTYSANYDNAPQQPPENIALPPVPGVWTFCGRTVPSPLGIAAGPLLNGRWILYYAELGFDVLTYKTVRSRPRECYSMPNLQPVEPTTLRGPTELVATHTMQGSWAVSFGMPSKSPNVWRADVEWTRNRLAREKLLSVSVVATPEPGWTLDMLASDFACCARWALESGADCIETNFSCPNVATCDGQLFQQPKAAGLVAQAVRDAVGKAPYVIKIGYLGDEELANQLINHVAPYADALSMTNCISATVRGPSGELMFAGQQRGIGGAAIRNASVDQVRRMAGAIHKSGYALRLIGVGGISQGDHVRQYLDAGAESVHLATALMIDPTVGLQIRRDLAALSLNEAQ